MKSSDPSPAASSHDSREATGAAPELDRRAFLGSVGGAAALGATGAVLPALAGGQTASAQSSLVPPTSPAERATAAYRIRVQCARQNLLAPLVPHPANGDELLYPDRIGSYSKGLPHNAFGEVDPSAYQALLDATTQGTQSAFESVPPGWPDPTQRQKLVSPLAGLAFDLEGVDAHNTTVPAAPAFASAEAAGEIVENYWMALLRDVPFAQYATHPLVQAACADLSGLSDFRGPKQGGLVTPQTLFRDPAPGVTVGPHLSQFWWRSQPFGAQHVEPRMRTYLPAADYLTSAADWLAVQKGFRPATYPAYDAVLRYMRTGRDQSQWVHVDVLYQAYFQALLTLLTPPDPSDPFTGGGMGVPPNQGNPYVGSLMQDGFATFGGPHFATILTEVSTRALHATWYQKWFVHRRLRPEAFAGRVHHHVVNGRPYPLHADVLNSAALAQIQSQHGGSCFLPMAYPEGSPCHPAYTAGHATVAGACVTILKACFHGEQPVLTPRIPSDDGLTLVPYTGPGAHQLTVAGELNKLAVNVAYGRNVAGVHWRSDGYESLRLGEEVALSLLRDQRSTYAESFSGLTFTRFDGTQVTV